MATIYTYIPNLLLYALGTTIVIADVATACLTLVTSSVHRATAITEASKAKRIKKV